VARLDALPAGESGKPSAARGPVSRRSLFSISSAVRYNPVAIVDETACLGVTRCGVCVASCHEHAIHDDGPIPTIDTSACTACGACVPSCPTSALRLSGASIGQIEAQLNTLLPRVDGIVFACASVGATAPMAWGLVELPTLAILTAGWLLQVKARGVDVALAHCDDERCAATSSAAELATYFVSGSRAHARASDMPIRLREPLATTDAIARMAEPSATDVIESPASPLGLLELSDSSCTLCGACAFGCPTGALVFAESGEGNVLSVTPGACNACSRCVEICPEDALAVRRGIDRERVGHGTVELMRARRERCPVCGTELAPRQMRRRINELLGRPDAPLELCSGCAAKAAGRERRPT
jgi:ferredoxin